MLERITFETAIDHITTKIPFAAPAVSIGQIRAAMAGEAYECAAYVVICDDGQFLGIIKIETLLAADQTSTVAALLFPWIFDRLGPDPAFGSGPLATVVQDLLSILLYFAITSLTVH